MNQKNRFWEFRASAEPDNAELLLYGPISEDSWWGDEVTPKQFAQDLKVLGTVKNIHVYINSSGGDVFAGQAIHSMLKRHSANIHVHVDGLAASIASVIAMAGDTVSMPRNSMMMVHNPWTIAIGNASDMRKMADDLDKIRESIVAAYQEKSGADRDKIVELMDAETWLTAEEAVEYGFADKLDEAKSVAASLSGKNLIVAGLKHDISQFRNVPQLAVVDITTPPAETKPEGVRDMDLEAIKAQYPDLHSAIIKAGREEGVLAERERIKAIEDLAIPGFEQMITEAKFETGAEPEAVAVAIVKATKAHGAEYMASVKSDAEELAGITPDAAPDADAKDKETENLIIEAATAAANSRR